MGNCLWLLVRIFRVVTESSLQSGVGGRLGSSSPLPDPLQLLQQVASAPGSGWGPRLGGRGVGGIRRGGAAIRHVSL